jgi:hypothetical protein
MLKAVSLVSILSMFCTMTSSPKFMFPFETSTPGNSKPTNTTSQLLQRQLFSSARSIPSAQGGGLHSHLPILVGNADYTARVGFGFVVPIHPGLQPVAVGSTDTG